MLVGEHFYSIQGEGMTTGIPAYFIRLQGCNLNCKWCDSVKVWETGSTISNKEIVDIWDKLGILNDIIEGNIHVVWTGGEPTLPRNFNDIISFNEYFYKTYHTYTNNEIETNGTVVLQTPEEYLKFSIISCSPKLSNSGISKEDRIVPDAISQIKLYGGIFKFVIDTEEDIIEAQNDFIIPYELYKSSILLMPKVNSVGFLPERMRFIFEMSKKYRYQATSRLHILAWDKTIGC